MKLGWLCSGNRIIANAFRECELEEMRRGIIKRFLDDGRLVHPNLVTYILESGNPPGMIDEILVFVPRAQSPVRLGDFRNIRQWKMQRLKSFNVADARKRIEKLRALERSSTYEGERRVAKRKADELAYLLGIIE